MLVIMSYMCLDMAVLMMVRGENVEFYMMLQTVKVKKIP